MSRIFDALRKADQHARRSRARSQHPAYAEPDLERRRSQRAVLSVPVMVYGHLPGHDPFHEDTRTLQVNANGGLLTLRHSVHHGQRLLLFNPAADAEVECRVVFVGQRQTGETAVGVEFAAPGPGFWPVEFPPDRYPR